MSGETLLKLYRMGSAALAPLAPALISWRQRRGKEDAERSGERLGHPSRKRPEGRLAWLHGASVGESLALLPLVEKLARRGCRVLITTGTVSSARILESRLPPGAAHQFVPLDVPRFVNRFLDHWQPDIALFAESELWPNMLCGAKARHIPVVLVNARLSERSFQRWQKAPALIGNLLRKIDLCLAQSQDDASRLLQLGAPRVHVSGNLKYDVAPPPFEQEKLAEMVGAIGPRPIWFAASTHPGEEEIAARVHGMVAQKFPDLLTIVAPRHADRGPAIAAAVSALGVAPVLRSSGAPINRETAFYIADTMGEMGLFFRLPGIVFVGKSLAGSGGQNPIEPAKLGSAILHGPNVANFVDVYRELDKSGGALEVADADTLARILAKLFADQAELRKMARAASEVVDRLGGASQNIMQALEPYFMQMRVESR